MNPVTWNLPILQAQVLLFRKPFMRNPGKPLVLWQVSPAAIGLVMADTAMKASAVKITSYMTPDMGTAHSNEVILPFPAMQAL